MRNASCAEACEQNTAFPVPDRKCFFGPDEPQVSSSAEQPRKFLQKGQSTHLISANNVADALGHILLSEPVAAAQIYNITQETDGLNDYCRLADQLAHREQDSATYMTSSWGRRIRHLMSSLRSQAHSGPYLQVLENQLIREGFSYKNSVISDLREYTG